MPSLLNGTVSRLLVSDVLATALKMDLNSIYFKSCDRRVVQVELKSLQPRGVRTTLIRHERLNHVN